MAYFMCHGVVVEAQRKILQNKKISYQGRAKLPLASRNLSDVRLLLWPTPKRTDPFSNVSRGACHENSLIGSGVTRIHVASRGADLDGSCRGGLAKAKAKAKAT
jgi:hypothetical protein